jgi:hypothetical protein
MRANEFLINEASVFKTVGNQYVPGYRMMISTKTGGSAVNAVKSQVPDFNTTEELTIVDKDTPSKYQVQLTVGRNQPNLSFKLQRANGDVIELLGSKSGIEKSLNGVGPAPGAPDVEKVKLPNQGDTAEAFLGAAMFAKLIKRESGKISDVTSADVWDVLDKMAEHQTDEYRTTVKGLKGEIDTIWFKLKAKGIVRAALANPELRSAMNKRTASPVNYVNSHEASAFADTFYSNGKVDEIGIVSDGLSASSARKSDVYTLVRDPETHTVATEMLPISLKAGADQFAQHSGSSAKAMIELFSHLGVHLEKDSTAIHNYNQRQADGDKVGAAEELYDATAAEINSQFSDSSPTAEAKFIDQLSRALQFWATGNNPNIRLVSFGRQGKFEVLRFDNLIPVMTNMNLNLRATVTGKENPTLIISDSKQGVLFKIRTYMQAQDKGPYQRNVIEKGPLLGKIANAISEEESQEQAAKKSATDDAAKAAKKDNADLLRMQKRAGIAAAKSSTPIVSDQTPGDSNHSTTPSASRMSAGTET